MDIFHIQVFLFIFCNSSHDTETGTADMWETTNSKPLGPIIMIDQWETLRSSQIIFIALFFGGLYSTLLLQLLAGTANCAIMLSQNHFPEPNWRVLTFLHPILLCMITYEHCWRCPNTILPSTMWHRQG
jgi:hypothetical protein